MSQLKQQIIDIGERFKKLNAEGKLTSHADQILIDLATLDDVTFSKELIVSTRIMQVLGVLRAKALGDVKMKSTELFQKLSAIQKGQKPVPIKSTSSEDIEMKRTRCRNAFYDALKKVEDTLTEVSVSSRELSVAIEKTIFEKADADDRTIKLLSALTDKTKVAEFGFAKKMLEGVLAPHRFASFENEDLLTYEQTKAIELDKEEASKNLVVPKPLASKSVNFRCRCGSNDVSFYQQQTRSADEPMTNFCHCHKCGRDWRE